MKALRSCLVLLALAVALLVPAGSAQAACDAFDEETLAAFDRTRIVEMQTGLRAAYRDDNALLRDGRLGGYTRARLQALCFDVPRPPGTDDLAATLDLTDEYAGMERLWPNWARDLFSLTLTDQYGAQATPLLGVRLAGPQAMKTLAIGRRALNYDCADPVGALADHPEGRRAFASLRRLYPEQTDEQTCKLLPLAGGVTEWQQAMTRLASIASDRRAGAIATLQSGPFMTWIEASRENRLRRLVGTVPAVQALLDEYERTGAPTPGATNYAGGPCSPDQTESTTTYYALTAEDVEGLDLLISLSPKLDAFRAEAGGFDSAQSLWEALRPVLAQDLDNCILAEIETLVKGPDRLPLSFLLKPTATEALLGDESLASAQPVLTELAPLRTATKAELVNRIRAGLQVVQDEKVAAVVDAAADTMAAASEPAQQVTDTAILEPEDEEEPPAPAPVITVTDATDEAVASAIDNPEIAEALRNTPMVDVSVPELIRSQVRAAARREAERQARVAVDSQIARIEPAITSEWTLTNPLMDEILALPYVRATMADATADGAKARLQPLVGASYPSLRLFKDALATISFESGKVPFSRFVEERIIAKAQKRVDDAVPRRLDPLQIEDCRCIPRPDEEDPQVTYGFFPFWLAPAAGNGGEGAPVQVAMAADGAAPQDAKPAPDLQPLVDFGLMNRVAFYGLEILPTARGGVRLRNAEHWHAARWTFVNSAHHFRASADLAFDLRGWTEWDEDAIEQAVALITGEMGRFDRRRGWEPRNFIEAIPTLFDRPQPDGVTLIFHDYNGVRLEDADMKRMIRIIKRTFELLPGRDDLAINVAFDFQLVKEEKRSDGTVDFVTILDEPVFDDLYDLLQKRPYVFADEMAPISERSEGAADGTGAAPAASDESRRIDVNSRENRRVVDNILLFLERPTTDAKKGLRFRMEQGRFQGEARREALRSIIPVLPPGGHREVRTSAKDGDPDRSRRPDFSQFDDDVVYFKDNFGGIGFWPIPDSRPGEEGAPPTEAQILNATVRAHFFPGIAPPDLNRLDPALRPMELAVYAPPLEGVCRYVCPNRAKITLGAMALFLVLTLVTWRAFYNGAAERIAFRFLYIGVFWIGNGVLITTLVMLSICDPLAYWPGFLWKLLVGALLLVLLDSSYQKIKNGPMP